MSCNSGKTDGETKKLNRKCFFQQKKIALIRTKTFASFLGVSFVKKHVGNKWRNTEKLIKNFKFWFVFLVLPELNS